MKIIPRILETLEIGALQSHRNLSVFPLVLRSDFRPDYLTLDEAIASGQARVTEVHAGGSVPQLRFVNDGDRPVLLLDGEELVGAKQNRVLNLTVLAPPRTEIVIPVSCVEAGRWAYSAARDFASAKHLLFTKARASKARQVSASLFRGTGARSDQGAVWSEIAQAAAALDGMSPTSEMGAVYRRHDTTLDDYVGGLRHVPDQVGGIFAIDGKVLGLELLDAEATMKRLLPKLVRSYALDAIRSGGAGERVPTAQSAKDFLSEVATAEMRTTDSLGLGLDVRLSSPNLAGGALVDEDRVVHLSAFRLESESDSRRRTIDSRLQSFSRRARRWDGAA